jgi:hypothetical protein
MVHFVFNADPDLAFHLMRIRIRIQLPKILRIHADPDSQPYLIEGSKTLDQTLTLVVNKLSLKQPNLAYLCPKL